MPISVRSTQRNADPIDQVSAIPTVGMGLYDDYDDDLGAPWAFPLVPFHKI